MKACPQCASTYSDRIEFCFHDGAVLDAAASQTDAPGSNEPWDLPSPAGFDLPAPPPQVRQAAMTPTPLAPFVLPVTTAQSALPAPPPPPVNPDDPLAGDPSPTPPPAPALDDTPPSSTLTPTPSPVPRATPPPAAAAPAAGPTEDASENEGLPVWIWWAGLGVAAVALVAATVFAAGGLGLLGAATAARTKPPVAANPPAAAPAAMVDPEPVDDDRFPEAPLELGVIASDTEDSDLPSRADGVGDPVDSDSGTDPGVGGTAEPSAAPPPATSTPSTEPVAPLVVGTRPLDPPTAPPSGVQTGSADPDGRPAAPPDPADSPWGAVADDPAPAPTVTPPEAPPAASDAGTVLIFLQGDASGLELLVNGQRQSGTFPHSLKLSPGRHRFKVQDAAGNGYDVEKRVAFNGDEAMRIVLIAP